VREIVTQHGGTMELRDAEPHGLRAVIRLPRL
jgi:two-component system, OmpR family, sensor histidine kinase TctE